MGNLLFLAWKVVNELMYSFFGFAHMLSFLLSVQLSLVQFTNFPTFTFSNCLSHPVAGHERMARDQLPVGLNHNKTIITLHSLQVLSPSHRSSS